MMSPSELRRLWIAALIAIVTVTGCTNRVGDLAVISTRKVDLSAVQMDPKVGERVKGSHCTVNVLIPILPNLGKAVENALEGSNGDALVDQVTYLSNYFIGIGSLTCLRVEGRAVRFQPRAS